MVTAPAIEGGDLTGSLGSGAEVPAPDRTVATRDVRADPDVWVAGGRPGEADPYPFLLDTAASDDNSDAPA
ncbi:hypothetical protein E6W39_12105 [Kitasatospora acidiphila]|uniref:Uncharacterized protein n=1 Tax=Kitasatospora acidiphila TaxID=2567942 RepID=A0A540W1M3_9ACTN|nr:hypothetical protein [Kitasatospora acidiphila]TQF02867.1 hypothetical protein E6W39_12105 [Kitasatospora acidiphila]